MSPLFPIQHALPPDYDAPEVDVVDYLEKIRTDEDRLEELLQILAGKFSGNVAAPRKLFDLIDDFEDQVIRQVQEEKLEKEGLDHE